MMKRLIVIPLWILLLSCGKEEGDLLTLESVVEPTVEQSLVLGGQDGNHRGIGIYSVEGSLLRSFNFRAENAIPRGLTPFDSESFLVNLDTTDSIFRMTVDGEKTLFHGSAQFNGTQYGIVRSEAGLVYATESNRIEVFDAEGIRLTTHYITTTVGGCVLSSPRGLFIRSDGRLVVADAGGGGKILVYDITNATPVCDSSVAFANTPYGVIEHSDGNLYITTQGDDQVYRADPDGSNPVSIWPTDTSLINNPTAILELPSGNLLVASSTTDTVEQLLTDGTRVGTAPFIRDTSSLNISSMTLVGDPPDEE